MGYSELWGIQKHGRVVVGHEGNDLVLSILVISESYVCGFFIIFEMFAWTSGKHSTRAKAFETPCLKLCSLIFRKV